jgi:hypothetical protein
MDERDLRAHLDNMRIEHRDLDMAIDALVAAGAQDQLRLARLKKRKLRLRDEMVRVETLLIPDIIA